MKQKLDERQIQEATKIASISFYVMYGVCALAIILQLIVTGRLENVIGETAVIAAGGIVYLSGSVKKGLSRENSPSPLRSLFESTVFSALFTVFYVFAIRRKAGPEAENQYCCPSLFYRDHGSLLLHTETYEFHDREETQTTGTKIFR